MPAPFFVALLVIVAVAGVLTRPRWLDWGSTPQERRSSLPGDDLFPDATTVTTRAVTIEAPVSAVWPWIVQMGQDRAGFYTHNWVERLLRSGIPDVHEIHPQWQGLEAGDLMRTNHDIGGKPLGWPVLAVDPGRSIVVRSTSLPAGTYAFVLQPIDDASTRFIVRDRAAWRRREWPFKAFVYEPLHAYMETGVLKGVKQRAEGRALARA
jgi:hypothetical protein